MGVKVEVTDREPVEHEPPCRQHPHLQITPVLGFVKRPHNAHLHNAQSEPRGEIRSRCSVLVAWIQQEHSKNRCGSHASTELERGEVINRRPGRSSRWGRRESEFQLPKTSSLVVVLTQVIPHFLPAR